MKKYLVLSGILVLAAVVSQNTAAQSWNELLTKADSLSKAQNYDSAISTGKLALQKAEAEFGLQDTSVAFVLNELGTYYYYKSAYDEAEPLWIRSLAIREKVFGPVHKDVATCLSNLGVLYDVQGKFADAEPCYKRALAIQEELLGPEHLDVVISLNNMALFYCHKGRFTEAVPPLKRAVATCERSISPENPIVATSLNNLAGVYLEQGKYNEAELLFRQALDIRKKNLGPEHHDVAESFHNLAGIYNEQGNYIEAERLFKQALVIREKVLGPDHPYVAMSLGNLAGVYNKQGESLKAEPLYERALAIFEKVFGPEHPLVANNLNSLASLYYEQEDYSKAEPLFMRALAIREKVCGSEHPDVAASLHNLASLYSIQGKYEQAGQFYKDAIATIEETLGPKHPDLAHHLESFSGYLHRKGDNNEALSVAREAFEIRKANFRDGSSVMAERDALTYSKFMRLSASTFLSVYFDAKSKDTSDLRSAADVVFSVKGRASEAIFVRAAEVNMLNQLGALADSLRLARTQLSKLYVSGPGRAEISSHRAKLDKVTSEKERFESELARTNVSYHNLKEALDVDSEKIMDILNTHPRRLVLVEFMKYDHHSPDSKTTEPRYVVLVMDKDDVLDIIDLGPASEIDKIVERYRAHILGVSSSREWPSTADGVEYRELGASLYERIWLPIEDLITGSELILLAPDGGLNMISFAGLINGDERYVIESYPIHYLSSGRDLIRLKDPGRLSKGLFALGDPDYDAPVAARLGGPVDAPGSSSEEPTFYASRNVRSSLMALREMHVTPLPGTRVEIEEIAAGWKRFSDEPVRVRLGAEASEERFKTEAIGNRVIHLATHGYFLEDIRQSDDLRISGLRSETSYIGENPLLLSGLFFAGANLHGEGADTTGAEDGILTAEEVTTLNFNGTHLVVLSACETGLGEVKLGEGVYGLRRAFLMAGARSVISALWPVSDEMTADIMSNLYGKRRESLPETIRRVQLETIDELRRQNRADHPFSWGAFIALGDWR